MYNPNPSAWVVKLRSNCYFITSHIVVMKCNLIPILYLYISASQIILMLSFCEDCNVFSSRTLNQEQFSRLYKQGSKVVF